MECIETQRAGQRHSADGDPAPVADGSPTACWKPVSTRCMPSRCAGRAQADRRAQPVPAGRATLAEHQLLLGQAFADIATIAVVHTGYVSRHDALARTKAALSSRNVIEQAKGVLAYRDGLDMAAAYDELKRLTGQSESSLDPDRQPGPLAGPSALSPVERPVPDRLPAGCGWAAARRVSVKVWTSDCTCRTSPFPPARPARRRPGADRQAGRGRRFQQAVGDGPPVPDPGGRAAGAGDAGGVHHARLPGRQDRADRAAGLGDRGQLP